MRKTMFVMLTLLTISLFVLTANQLKSARAEPQHDIAVVDVKTNKTIVGENYHHHISINVTVENQGDYQETFNVTVYINDVVLGTYENVVLEINESKVLTPPCKWNTTGLPKGNYTIKAYASPVPEETDTEDNTRESWVFITILGDIDGDKVVNIKDAVPLGVAFGSNPSDPLVWDPNADLNDDYFINVKDAIILGANFGQSWS